MADYLTTARSNYFKVKNPKAFEEMLGKFGLVPEGENKFDEFEFHRDEAGAYCIFGYGVNGSIELNIVDGQGNEITLFKEIQKHLDNEERAVIEEIGHEKCRYVTGFVVVITSKEIRGKSLDDVASELGVLEEIR